MEEFEPSSRLGIGNGGVRAKFRHLEFEMEEFEPSTDTCNWEWLSSRLVPRLGSGNGGVRAKFRRLESGMEEFEQGSNALNRKWRSSSQV